MADPLLPPPYRARRLAGDRSAVALARQAAADGVEEGTLFWSDRSDRMDAALVLRPDRARRDTLPVIYVAGLAFATALGTFAPPPTPISFRWPGGIIIDGGLAGDLSLDCAPSAADAVPAWAVLGMRLALAGGAEEPGRAPYRTSVVGEDFEGFSVVAQIEGFCRHFLAWLERWEAEGLAPVAAEWWRRAAGFSVEPTRLLPDAVPGVPLGLDSAGNLRVRREGRERVLRLEAALADPAIHA
jgi:biotin-(acetyl-CoA carboxylase) ligase